jgi:hypothetical protein
VSVAVSDMAGHLLDSLWAETRGSRSRALKWMTTRAE